MTKILRDEKFLSSKGGSFTRLIKSYLEFHLFSLPSKFHDLYHKSIYIDLDLRHPDYHHYFQILSYTFFQGDNEMTTVSIDVYIGTHNKRYIVEIREPGDMVSKGKYSIP